MIEPCCSAQTFCARSSMATQHVYRVLFPAKKYERCAWQVRIFPLTRSDVLRADFSQVWSIADASSVAWSTCKGVGGVGEFLLSQHENIQKFMRKAMFHVYSARRITVEITERGPEEKEGAQDEKKEEGNGQKKDAETKKVLNRAVFRFSSHLGRQLIKTFYPTAKGEMTERSVYVNNVSPGVSIDIIKAIFPCALKISIAKAGKEASLGLVETESAEAAMNYLVVYDKIDINGRLLVLTTTEYDWQGAKDKYQKKKGGTAGAKRPSSSTTSSSEPPVKKDRTSSSPSSVGRGSGRGESKGRGGPPGSRGAARGSPGPSRSGPGLARGGPGFNRGGPGSSRGGLSSSRGGPGGFGPPRGSSSARGRGRGLLPDPVHGGRDGGGSEGLLPLPSMAPPPKPPSLLSLPAEPSSSMNRGGDVDYGYGERDAGGSKLHRVREQLESEVRETRASLVMATRRAEAQAVAQLQKQLSLLERLSSDSRRSGPSGDFHDEEPLLPPPRRPLLPLDDEGGEYPRKRPGLLDSNYDYDAPTYPEDDYPDYSQRPSGPRGPRPFLLDAPDEPRPIKDPYSGTSMADNFEYAHKPERDRGGRYGGESLRPPPLLGRRGEGLLEKPRRGLLDDDGYDYDAPSAPPTRRPYGEEGPGPRGRPPPRGYGDREAARYGYGY